MPIQYYCGITLNQNSIVTPVIDPLATAPSVGTEVEGQQYYNSTTNLMYFWNGTAWVEMDGTGSGVASINIDNTLSTFVDLANTGTAANPILDADLNATGTASGTTFLRGDNVWATPAGGGNMSSWLVEGDGANPQTITDGDTLDVVGSTYLTSVASSPAANNFMVQISHDLTSRTDTTSAASPAYGAAFSAVDSVTTNSTGHVTALNLKTVTLPAASSRWTAVGETGSEVVSYGDTVNFLNDTNGGIDTKVDTSTADVSVLLKMDVNDLSTLASPATGDFIPLADISDSGNTKKATIANILALAPQGDVTSVESATAVAQRGIKVTNPNGPIPVVGLDIINQVNLATTPAVGDELIIYDLSTTTNKSITVGNLVAAAPQGVVTSIGNGTFTTVGGTAAVPVINVTTATAKTASTIMARDSGGFSFVETPASGDSTDKIATTAFVQQAVTGLLQFISGFNASTGIIADGSGDDLYTDRAISVGDYYVVTVAGNFFGNAATPLTVGDSVIVQDDAAAGAAAEADFIIVQSDTDLATLTTVGIGNVNPGTGIGVVYSSGTATVTNSSPNIVQDLWATFTADSGSTTANSATDSLSVVGASGITTSIAGDVLTITGSSTYVLPLMTSTVRGGAELFSSTVQTVAAKAVSTTADRTYGLQLNSDDQLVVNIPWTDTSGEVTSVAASTATGLRGLSATPTIGDVVVGLDIANMTAGTVGSTTEFPGVNTTTNFRFGADDINTYLQSKNTYAVTISAMGTVTHSLNSFDVIVQLYNATTYETIEACVDRATVDTVAISGSVFPAGNIRVLVSKIG